MGDSPIIQRMGWAANNEWWDHEDKNHKRGSWLGLPPGYLAKLGFKEEAAGKVRVFAMVDPWTQ